MKQHAERAVGGRRWLLFAGIACIVVGAGLMDQAGRTQLAMWWNISGAFAFLGVVLTAVYLLLQEGPTFFATLTRRSGRSGKRTRHV